MSACARVAICARILLRFRFTQALGAKVAVATAAVAAEATEAAETETVWTDVTKDILALCLVRVGIATETVLWGLEPLDMGPLDLKARDTGAADSEATDTDAGDTEAADTEAADTDAGDTEAEAATVTSAEARSEAEIAWGAAATRAPRERM